MVFGFGYAVIAGYLVARPNPLRSVLLFMAWLAGRVVIWLPLPIVVEFVTAIAFPILLFALAGIPFVRAAKKGRNVVFAPLLGGLVVAELLYQLARLERIEEGDTSGILLAMNLMALLMFAMGGRIIAAATSGAHQRLGYRLSGGAHPRLDIIGMVSLASVALLEVFNMSAALSALLSITAAGVIFARLNRWRVWRTVNQLDVSLLHVGYLWLAMGLTYVAIVQVTGTGAKLQTMHAVMIGAFGTLSIVMMVRVSLQRLRMTQSVPPEICIAVVLISVSALARLGALHSPYWSASMALAAVAWLAAFVLVLGFFVRLKVRSISTSSRSV